MLAKRLIPQRGSMFVLPLVLVACLSPASPEGDSTQAMLLPPPASTAPVPAFAQPAQTWFDRSLDLQLYDDSKLREIASTDIAVFQLRQLLSEEGAAAVASIRAVNPDIVILGVFQVLSYQELWNQPDHRERFPMSAAMYDLLKPHEAVTTTGRVPLMWADSPMLTPLDERGALNHSMRTQMVDIIVAAATRHPGVVDGIFHDYMSPRPWMVEQGEEWGDVDLDGDGEGAGTDLDDREVWVDWQRMTLDDLQERFGPGFIQVANGRLPHRDPEIASRLAGVAFEAFPNLVWGYTDQGGLELVMEHLEPGYLTPRRGRTYNMLWDRSGRNPEFCRTASLLTGEPYCLSDLGSGARLDPMREEMGAATGELRIEILEDASTRFERSFENGIATLEVSPSGETRSTEIETY